MPPRGHGDDSMANLGDGEAGHAFLSENFYEHVTSLVGAGNMSEKISIIV